MGPEIDILLVAPLPPKGKGRPRIGVVAGHAHAFTPAETRRWEAQLAALAQAQLPAAILDGPLRLDVLAVFPRTQELLAQSKRTGAWKHGEGLIFHASRPDLDNVCKAVLDALKSFWRDDACVSTLNASKVYAEATGRPRVVVRIRREDRDPTDHARYLGLLDETEDER